MRCEGHLGTRIARLDAVAGPLDPKIEAEVLGAERERQDARRRNRELVGVRSCLPSAHLSSASSAGQSSCPHSVSR